MTPEQRKEMKEGRLNAPSRTAKEAYDSMPKRIKSKNKLFDAQAQVNILCAYYENPEFFTDKMQEEIPKKLSEIYKLLEEFQIDNKIT